jgi:hypothetical protein
MSDGKDWNSISVTEAQKATLKEHKPDNVAMGKFLVGVVEGEDFGTGVDPAQIRVAVEAALNDADVGDERDLSVLLDGLMNRMQDMDDDVRNAAKEGAREAVEEVAAK